jgi:hypothetical protein
MVMNQRYRRRSPTRKKQVRQQALTASIVNSEAFDVQTFADGKCTDGVSRSERVKGESDASWLMSA